MHPGGNSMIRFSRRIFTDLAIYMMGFGLVIGFVFPFFMTLLGVPVSYTMQLWFFIVCIIAGLIVGAMNILLARSVVGSRLHLIANKMKQIGGYLSSKSHEAIVATCSMQECLVEKDSDDELGECAESYNQLISTLYASFQQETMVKSFSQLLSSRLELDDLAASVLPALLEHTGAEAGALLVEENDELRPAASFRIDGVETLKDREFIKRVAQEKKRITIELPENIAIEGSLLTFRPASIILEPIVYHDVVLAIILLAFIRKPGDEVQRTIDLISPNLSVAIRNSLSYDQLQRLAANDSLTGLFNRRFGMARLQEEFGRAVRNSAPIGVCIFDLDHFKLVNDTYGHQVGDKVLVFLSKIIRSALREGDIAMRYGGEEFMTILPGASMTDAYQIAERIRRMVEESEFQYGPQRIRITISGGVSSWPDFDASSADALVKRADESLYAAKEGGRNRVAVL